MENRGSIPPLTEQPATYILENRSYQIYFQIACGLSMLGSLLIILTYILFSDLRTTSRLLLVFLSFMDLGTALANSIGMAMDYKHTSEGCKIQAAFAVFCSMSSYFWTAAIAFYLYLTIVREKQSLAKKLVKVFHIVAWGVPFIIVVLAGALNVLGYEDVNLSDNKSSSTVTGGWCFIRKSPGPKSERNQSHFTTRSDKAPVWYDKQWFEFWVMIAGGAWQIAAFIFCVVIYILIKIHIYREKHGTSHTFITRESLRVVYTVDRKLTFIPIVFLLLYVWTLIRIFGRFSGNDNIAGNKGLIVLEGIADCLQGATNALIFCLFTKAVRDHYITTIRLCCQSVIPCCQRERKMIINQRKNQRSVYPRRMASSNGIPQIFASRRLSPSLDAKGSDGQGDDVISWPDVGYPNSPTEEHPYANYETAPLLTNRT